MASNFNYLIHDDRDIMRDDRDIMRSGSRFSCVECLAHLSVMKCRRGSLYTCFDIQTILIKVDELP